MSIDNIKVKKQEPFSYRVDVDDTAVERMLDLDVTLREQPAPVRQEIIKIANRNFDREATEVLLKEAEEGVQFWTDQIAQTKATASADMQAAVLQRFQDNRRFHKAEIFRYEQALREGSNLDMTGRSLIM